MASQGADDIGAEDWACLLAAQEEASTDAATAVAASQSLPPSQARGPESPGLASGDGRAAMAAGLAPMTTSSSSSAPAPGMFRRLAPSDPAVPAAKRFRSAGFQEAQIEETPDLGSGYPGLMVYSHLRNWQAHMTFPPNREPNPHAFAGVLGCIWCGKWGKWATIYSIQCQNCDLMFSPHRLTSQSLHRAQRRLQRVLHSCEPSAAPLSRRVGTVWGSGQIICTDCGRGDWQGDQQYVAELAREEVVDAQLTLHLVCRDQNAVAVDETVTFDLGKDSQRKMQAELFRLAAGRLRSHFARDVSTRAGRVGDAEGETDQDEEP